MANWYGELHVIVARTPEQIRLAIMENEPLLSRANFLLWDAMVPLDRKDLGR